MNVSFAPPDITQVEIDEVVEVLKSGWITTGPKTKLFEQKISEYCNTKKTICLNSATAAMELALRLFDIKEGDEVITSSYTFTASASVIAHVGAKIVLVDTDENSFEMDYNQLENAITSKTKAIIPVDIAGVICDYDRILDIVNSKKHLFQENSKMQQSLGRIMVLADGAHSFGAVRKGKNSGQIADFTSFSFHAVKNITTAEGGALTWNDIEDVDNDYIYKQLCLFALHGQSKDAFAKTQKGKWKYDIKTLGYKYNMTDIMAALGLGQLSRYQDLLARRKEIVDMYDNAFKNTPITTLKHYDKDFSSSFHLYFIRLDGKTRQERDDFIDYMSENDVAVNVHYMPLPMFTAYKELGFKIDKFPNALKMFENQVTLPLHTSLTNEQVQYVIDLVLRGI
jgi:dTDP-4-amino-4,6-dideoxygalactose transaminase